MPEADAGVSANDTGIPADMLVEGAEPAANPHGDVTGLATRLGWKPKEEWRGAEDKWLDPSAYVDEIEREAPKVKERLRTQKEIISAHEASLREIAERTRKQDEMITELLENQRNANQRGYARAESEILADMRQAVAEADTAKFDQRQAELDALRKIKPATPAQRAAELEAGQDSAVVSAWKRDNSWFGKDRAMSLYAQGVELDIRDANPSMGEADRLAKVREKMEKDFPEKFENPARRTAAAVASPGAQAARAPKPKGRTVADLDEHGKAALAKFKRTIPGFTDKDFLDTYKWDDKS